MNALKIIITFFF